jgi:hypothetical protein
MIKRFSIVLVLVLFIWACSGHKGKTVERGFYYWKTEFRYSGENERILKALHVKKLYMRFFDVSADKADSIVKPLQPIIFKDQLPSSIEVVPVVFITDESLMMTDSTAIPTLAKNIISMVDKMDSIYLKSRIHEIQLDCDWGPKTKNKYFSLLQNIKAITKERNWLVTATIRLYQVKYPNIAGVPPVDRGTLMAYNMQPVTKLRVKNSIIELKEEEKYLSNLDNYPLTLDVVLPIFYWGILFRNKVFNGILYELTEKEIKDNSFFEQIDDDSYQARDGVDIGGVHVEKGDIIRLEECDTKTLEKSVTLIESHNKTDSLNISFFSLDSNLVNHIGYEKLEDLYSQYR